MSSDARSATTRFEARQATRSELMSLTPALLAEFSDRVPAGIVLRAIADAREQLLASGMRTGLPHAVELRVRAQLGARSPAFRLT